MGEFGGKASTKDLYACIIMHISITNGQEYWDGGCLSWGVRVRVREGLFWEKGDIQYVIL